MKFIEFQPNKHSDSILVLCKLSIIKEVLKPDNEAINTLWAGRDIFGRTTKFIGLVDSAEDASLKYPEYFI